MRRHHLALLLIALLLLGGGWWLLGRSGDQAGGDTVARDDEPDAASGLASDEAREDAPSLAGSSDAEPPPAAPGTRGEVRVRALGRGGQPLPDLPVIVSDAEGGVLAAQFTNARGEQTFAGVPYDGTARIAACRLDERGTRTLHHVSSDQPLRITAWYGGGRGVTPCPVREGETIDVTVEVAPAK